MPTFSSKPLQGSPLLTRLRRYPFLLFGAPFITIVVASSFALSHFTSTKYELHDTKVTAMTKEEEMHMRKDRKRIDIREEYFRLSNAPMPSSSLSADPQVGDTAQRPRRKQFSLAATSQDELENVRVPRPAGMPEWGPARESEDDAPKVGSRKTDRWV